jgi:YD repeat-containing protein
MVIRPAKITDPQGNVSTFNYDANDNLKVARQFGQLNDAPGTNGNIRLAESRWKYDALGRPIEARDAFFNPATQAPIGDGASVTTFAYAPNGQCTNVTDDLGRVTRFGYDTVGRHISTTDARGNIQVAVLDEVGNCASTISIELSDLDGSPQVFSRTNVFDAWNRLVSTTDNLGNNLNWNFGGDSTLLRAVDARGAITRHEYDLLGRKTKTFQDMNDNDIVDAGDIVLTQTWDDNSRLVSSTDDNTNTTFYAYDSLNRQVLATSPDGTVHAFAWNASSDLVREQDANGTVITNRYDLLGRCVRRDITPGPGIATTTTFETFAYDGRSQLVAATNDVSHSEFEYNSFGDCTGNHNDGWNILRAEYDGVGNRVSMIYPSGRIVTYAYDALNQVSNVSSTASAMTPPTSLAQFAYAGPGRVARITRANGTRTDITWNGMVSPPNAPGDFGRWQRSGIGHTVVVSGAVIDQRRFAYDRNQNKILRAQTAPFFVGGDLTTNLFAYDALDRMTDFARSSGSTDDYVQTYVLDGNGNRQTVFSNGVPQSYVMDATIPPADFQMDQYTMMPFAGQAFDENGNLIARNSTVAQLQYQYDYANRLVAVNDLITGDPAPVASYSYNALGQRISKTVYPPAPSLPVTTEYIHDIQVGEVCDDNNQNSGDVLETRVFGVVGQLFVLDGSRSIDDGLVRFNNLGQAQYYHADDLGNVLALTDDLGAVLERYDYADFGLPSFLNSDGFPIATNASPTGNPFLFHGMEWDSETGLYFERSGTPVIEWTFEKAWPCRWDGGNYDPQTARAIRGKVKIIRVDINPTTFTLNPWSDGKGVSVSGFEPLTDTAGYFNPKEVGIDKSVPWHSKAARSRIPAGFVTKKTFGQLAGKK